MRVLILSVGGSDQPLVKAITTYRPDFTVFLCTETEGENKGSRETVDGQGKVCQGERESIVKQAGIAQGAYDIIIVPPDDPYGVYAAAIKQVEYYLGRGDEVIVDYTGGTKSMSVGLAVAAMENPRCSLSLVKGMRLDLVKVRDGLERVARLPVPPVYVERQKKLCRDFIKNWDYAAAARILDEINQVPLYSSPEEDSSLQRLLILCRGFNDWDRFAYREAAGKIDIYKKDAKISIYNKTLKQICAALEWYENWTPFSDSKSKPPVFVLVYDVLLNAERRAARGTYDDAVSRLYRALEMYGQFCLRTGTPPLTSDDIDVSLLPAEVRDDYEKKRGSKGKVQLGLAEDYDLLALLGHPVGAVWKKWRAELVNILSRRNYSFLAHGLQPVTGKDYQEMREAIWEFIYECDEAQQVKDGLRVARQLPVEL